MYTTVEFNNFDHSLRRYSFRFGIVESFSAYIDANHQKLHFQQPLLPLFDLKKFAAKAHRSLLEVYSDAASLYTTWWFPFQRFKGGDVNADGGPKHFEDNHTSNFQKYLRTT